MIQKVQTNSMIAFKSKKNSPAENKTTLIDKVGKARNIAIDKIKTVNNAVRVSSGFTKGVAQGATAAAVIGLVGKNCKNGEGKIIPTFNGIMKDAWSIVKLAPNAINNVWTKSPKDNVGAIIKGVPSSINKLAKGIANHKLTATIATVVAGAIVFANVLKSKVKANLSNADIDHALKPQK